jgi:DNA-nicking Smr family endonuclease
MSGRRLSDDERVLWSGVIRSIAPLRRPARAERAAAEPADDQSPGRPGPKPKKPVSLPGSKPTLPAAAKATAPASAPQLAPLGRRLKQRIARGNRAIDGRLDLHGMTQSAAHGALLRFLHEAQARGGRIVLVITGKGGGDPTGERGVLKRQVPLWLRLPEFRSLIVGFESAGIGHGGEGALYVSLRKAASR